MSGPVAATRPMALVPGIEGLGIQRPGVSPERICLEFDSMTACRTRTTTLPAVGLGVGMDWTSRDFPGPEKTSARQVSGRG